MLAYLTNTACNARDNGAVAVEVLNILLNCDVDINSRTCSGNSVLLYGIVR